MFNDMPDDMLDDMVNDMPDDMLSDIPRHWSRWWQMWNGWDHRRQAVWCSRRVSDRHRCKTWFTVELALKWRW
jgi:hypothetical protein